MDYYLIPNKLANDGSYISRPVVNQTYTEEELIDKMLSKRNVISKPDLEAFIAAIKETLIDVIKEGKGLNLPWLKLNYGMKGTFATHDAPLNATDHPLEININAGALLTEVVPEIKLKRVSSPDFGSKIGRVTDGVSKTVNSLLTPGGVFEITGNRLRIDGRDTSALGLYLRDQDGAETKVDLLLRNEPRYLSGQFPTGLPSGTYKLVVKTQVGTSGKRFLISTRTCISNFSLTVE